MEIPETQNNIDRYFKVLILHCNLKVLPKENANKNKKKKQIISHCEV